MRILFVTSNRLGDAVLSTGLLDYLLRAHPAAQITVVCGPAAEGVFARMPNRMRTIVLQKQRWSRHWLPLWAATATTVWDLIVDIRGSALSYLIPTRQRAVFRGGRGPKIAQLAAMLRLSPPPLPVAWTSEADRAHVAPLLPTGRALVALAPTANWAPKLWPAERFAAAFRAVAETNLPEALPVVLGGPGAAERAMAAPLLECLSGAVDLVGALKLPEVVAVLQRSALFIGNDSGLMHLAAASGTPTVGLFGPTDAATYGPAGPRATAVVRDSMEAINVTLVVEAVRALLGRSIHPGEKA